MNNKAKQKLIRGIIYLCSAFMVVVLLTVALITLMTGGLHRAGESAPPRADISDECRTTEPADDMPTATLDEPTDTAPSAEPSTEPSTEPSAEAAASLPERCLMPVEGCISKGHDLELAVYSLTMDDYRVHSGIDIECELGGEVCAFADGRVGAVWRDPFMGYSVELEHSGGLRSYYMNLSPELAGGIEAGCEVKCGQVIGYVGESAALEAAQSPHLHFEVTVDRVRTDPLDYIEYDPSLYPPDPDAEG